MSTEDGERGLERNQELFARPEDLREYLDNHQLFRVESHLIRTYLRPGMRVIELGCGGGRVTRHLVAAGCEVRAFDYNRAIVEEVRGRLPQLDIRHGDARSIAAADSSADVVFFSFNGIDYVPDEAGRIRCLDEAFRVLCPEGLFLFSSHNLKSFPLNVLLDRPRSFYLRNARLFFRAEERILEHEYGGFDTHYSSVGYWRSLLLERGFEPLEVIGDRMLRFPRLARLERALCREDYLETWLYYVARKPVDGTTGPNSSVSRRAAHGSGVRARPDPGELPSA